MKGKKGTNRTFCWHFTHETKSMPPHDRQNLSLSAADGALQNGQKMNGTGTTLPVVLDFKEAIRKEQKDDYFPPIASFFREVVDS